MRPLVILTAIVVIVAGLGLQQAQAIIIFEEDFGGVAHGTAVTSLPNGWTVHEGGMLYSVTSATIDVGNAAQGSAGGAGTNDASAVIPGGPYTLGAGEFFRFTYVARPGGGQQVLAFVSPVATGGGFPGGYMQLAMGSQNNNQAYTYSSATAVSLEGHDLTPTRHIRVEFDASEQRLYSSADGTTWDLHGVDTTAGISATAHSVVISSPGDASYMDSVVLEIVPEPGTFALLLAGLVGLVPVAWRRRRSR